MKLKVLSVLFVCCASVALGQGICIPEPVQSSAIEGTVYFGSETSPLPGVTVEIAKYAYEAPIVAFATTDKNGAFSVRGVKPGRYRLNAKHPVVGHLEVEFRLQSSSLLHRKKRIIIVIGTDPSKGACWGSYARTVRSKQSATTPLPLTTKSEEPI